MFWSTLQHNALWGYAGGVGVYRPPPPLDTVLFRSIVIIMYIYVIIMSRLWYYSFRMFCLLFRNTILKYRNKLKWQSDVDLFFSFERINTKKKSFFLSLHQPRTFHEYYLCMAIFTMSRKDVKHFNWPSLEVWNLRVLKRETRWGSAIKLWFYDDIIIKLYHDSHSPWWMNFADYSVNSQSIFMKFHTHYFPFMSWLPWKFRGVLISILKVRPFDM